MSKKKVKEEYLSMYEEDLIWMSYRYCIGRHTIAAHQHAGDIAKNAYHKLNPERRNFNAMDIRRSISDQLAWNNPAFKDSTMWNEYDRRPLEHFIEFLEKNNIHTYDEYRKIKEIECVKDSYTGDTYHFICDKTENANRYCSINDITDLLVWMDLASAFCEKDHKTCKTNYNGEIKEIIYFDSYIGSREEGQDFGFKKIKRPLEEYLKNPYIDIYIDENFIVNED